MPETGSNKTKNEGEAGDGPQGATKRSGSDGKDGPKEVDASELPSSLNELDLNDLIVETKDLCFSYSPKAKLLININMTFPRGAM